MSRWYNRPGALRPRKKLNKLERRKAFSRFFWKVQTGFKVIELPAITGFNPACIEKIGFMGYETVAAGEFNVRA